MLGNNFFNLEGALEHQEKLKATPKGKPKPKRKFGRCPATVKVVRGAAHQQLRAVDMLLCYMLGTGLSDFMVGDDSTRRNELQCQGSHFGHDSDSEPEDAAPLPATMCMHMDKGSPGFAMLRYLLSNKDLRCRLAR